MVVGYLLLPGTWQWQHAATLAAVHDNIVEQVEITAPAGDPALTARLAAASTGSQAAPIILTYHDIDYRGDKYTVSPESFAAQMQLIHDAGWTTLTSAQIRAWVRGEPLPPHSVMITFDDGARGVWKYADPILARNNQHAAAFIITGFVGTHAPYYLTWSELAELSASGRWDLEAHTHLGHVRVPSDASGGMEPFLTTMQYLPDQHRVETQEEYQARVLGDLSECKHQFLVHGLPEPSLFAFPFSAHDDDPAGTGILKNLVTSLYDAGMLDQADATSVTTSDQRAQGNIARMDVTADVTPDTLADRLISASPLEPAAAQPLLDTEQWMTSEQQATEVTIDDGRLVLDPGPGQDLSLQYARYRSSMWTNYTVSADIGTFEYSGDGTTTGLTVLVGDSRDEVQLSVSSSAYQVTQGYYSPTDVGSGELPSATTYHAVISVTPDQVVVTIDDNIVATVPVQTDRPHETAGGISVSAHRERDDSPVPAISNLTIT
ncbi:polysaccharide deacetylase family protein [Mycolicibacterium stellerae]|uniref:polysaccharide deacetylase family protein n=1 Tax=Mycolicibacterium stellerae TaxID=2358193 RepID=UPI0013DDC4FB|nr:polysaccharide deacetylase family protein [Mycolicibacterium stellerae]